MGRAAKRAMKPDILEQPTWSVAVQGLNPAELRRIRAALTLREFSAHDLLFVEGVSNDSIYIVETGRVRAYFNDLNGREFTTLLAGRGALLGIVTCLTNSPPVLSVQALGRVTVSVLGKQVLDEHLREIPVLARNFIHLLALANRDQMLFSKRIRDAAPIRLAKILRRLASLENHAAGSAEMSIRGLTQQELATMVGISRTWLVLMLSSFEKEGIVLRRRGRIVIADPDGLSALISRIEAGAHPGEYR